MLGRNAKPERSSNLEMMSIATLVLLPVGTVAPSPPPPLWFGLVKNGTCSMDKIHIPTNGSNYLGFRTDPFNGTNIIYGRVAQLWTMELICLRTLDLSCVYGGFEVLPSEVNRLLHLRYLDLSKTRLKELPETVRSLVNLQTLKLNGCYNLCKLPEGIGELSNLRHLEVEDTSSLKYYPRGVIERLRQLRTLSKFVVRDGSEGSMIGELENLNFLKGRLTIEGLRHVKSERG
ncbi:hypothetical protein IFM89_034946 [Coptis chinensis]|uniref:Disease resistance R13L4/SHOC-2-like LRR domain-containing protein n=1 Tax=Coptis chinensis TaxID=261450 RepID=A0A835I870_9MAGN|nr:hypothetical protein IFM89_034946 [Coptis chinensis]